MDVLWLDDDAEFLDVLEVLTSPWRADGHVVDLAPSAPDDDVMTRYDLVVCDLAMRPDGLTVVGRARARGTASVVVSAHADGQIRRLAVEAGAARVWCKSDLLLDWPTTPAELLGG